MKEVIGVPPGDGKMDLQEIIKATLRQQSEQATSEPHMSWGFVPPIPPPPPQGGMCPQDYGKSFPNQRAFSMTPIQHTESLAPKPPTMGNPDIFPKWITKTYHPSDPKDKDYGSKKALAKFFVNAKTMPHKEIVMAYFWSYHTPIEISDRVIFIEPPDSVMVAAITGASPDYALPPMATFRDAEVEKVWGHTLDKYLSQLYPRNIVSQPKGSSPVPEDSNPAIPAISLGPPHHNPAPQAALTGGWGMRPPQRPPEAPNEGWGQCIQKRPAEAPNEGWGGQKRPKPSDTAAFIDGSTTPDKGNGQPGGTNLANAFAEARDDSSMAISIAAPSQNTACLTKVLIDERFRLTSDAQKADFMALAHILGIKLSSKHFSKKCDRVCSLDEIVNAIISKYSGKVDPTKLPTTDQVNDTKVALKGSKHTKQLESNLAPALVTPLALTVAPVTVLIDAPTPGSDDSHQQESPEAKDAPVLNSQ